jgi:hypothetical protein
MPLPFFFTKALPICIVAKQSKSQRSHLMMLHQIIKFIRFSGALPLLISSGFLLTACSGQNNSSSGPESEETVSFFTGKKGGIKIGGATENKGSSDSLPVNAILWRAALDVTSFVPLSDVDTFGGSIVTEWHQTEGSSDQRLKLAVFVIGRELRSDAIKVH